jgi:hypothetical protein
MCGRKSIAGFHYQGDRRTVVNDPATPTTANEYRK